MKNLIIVGAGGLASDIYGYLQDDPRHDITVKGILTDDAGDYEAMNVCEPYLGAIKEYAVQDDDLFIVSIGENPGRKKIVDFLESEGADFFTFIHPSSVVHYSALIEEGSIIGPFCTVGSDVRLGKHAFLNKYCNIGHGSTVGRGLIMYPYAMIGGRSGIGENFVLSTRATVWPGLSVGDNCTVSANVFLKKSCGDNMLLFAAEPALKEMKL